MGFIQKLIGVCKSNGFQLRKNDSQSPVMLRPYDREFKGATAFFRNRPFIQTALELLVERSHGNSMSILFHASSVGAEPYSFALWWLRRFSNQGKILKIYATDISQTFLDVANAAVYPSELAHGMTDEEIGWFERSDACLKVPPDARATVQILPATSFSNPNGDNQYDAVFIMNALTYVTSEEQSRAIRNAAASAKYFVGLTAFHPDSIRKDIEDAGLVPYLRQQEEIHNAWGDRLTNRSIDKTSPDYSWRIPYFSRDVRDYEYKYCALFTHADHKDEPDKLPAGEF